MAKRKGNGRGKTSNARKLALENAQSAEKREKLKDDPGGTKANNMDDTKQLTTSKKQQSQTHYKSNVGSNNHLGSSSSSSSTTNKKHNTNQQHHRQQQSAASGASNSTATSTATKTSSKSGTAATATAAVTTHRSEKKSTADNHIQNAKMTLSETNKLKSELISSSTSSTNSDSSSLSSNINNNNNNNNNNSSNTNHNHSNNNNNNTTTTANNTATTTAVTNNNNETSNNNQKSLLNESSSTTWNNLKYLHKKFKRIASATTTTSSGGSSNHLEQTDATEKEGSLSMSSTSSSPTSASPLSESPPFVNGGNHGVSIVDDRVPPLTNGHSPVLAAIYAAESSSANDSKRKTNSSSNLSNNSDLALSNSSNCNVVGQVQRTPSTSASTTPSISPAPQSAHRLTPQQTANQQQPQQKSNVPSGDQIGQQTSRYVCPYCSLNCTKPSVLQKHIRAHTNERPYPCDICGFAFKTKSNYYKHCRSRSHALRKSGVEPPTDADEGSMGASDQEQDPEMSNSSSDVISRTTSPLDERTSSPAVLPSQASQQQSSTTPNSKNFLPVSSLASPALGGVSANQSPQPQPQQQHSPAPPSASPQQKYSNDKPYKPKFHNAALYAANKLQQQQQQSLQQMQQLQDEVATSMSKQQHQLQQQILHHHQASLQPPQAVPQQHVNNVIKAPSSHHLSSNHQLIPMQGSMTLPPHVSPTGAYYVSPGPPSHAQYYSAQHQQSPYVLAATGSGQRDMMAISAAHYQQQQQHQQQQQYQLQHSSVLASSMQGAMSSPSMSNKTAGHRSFHHPAGSSQSLPAGGGGSIAGGVSQATHIQQSGGNSGHSNKESSAGSAPTGASGAGTILGNISTISTAPGSGHQLTVELVQEHISKLISQNEAIVENKELLLQKKYPKTLNRSRSFTNANSTSGSAGSNSNLVTSSTLSSGESTSTKLAQAIAQKQQFQQQQQQLQLQQQQHQQQQQQLQQQQQQYLRGFSDEHIQRLAANTYNNGMSKNVHKMMMMPTAIPSQHQESPQQQQQQQRMPHISTPTPAPTPSPSQTPTLQSMQKEPSPQASINVPLNLSKATDSSANNESVNSRKRLSIESQSSPAHQSTPDNNVTSSTSTGKSSAIHPQNMGHSIIKNLLLNARGLAVPTGEGDDAVYTCPLCALEFRTAEDLQVHNSSYCQGSSSSAPISPASSPSCKYLRSNSINVSLPELTNPNSLVKLDKTSIFYSKNPLSLVKLAWSQLKTKPSTLVLNQLNGITASKASTSAEATSVSSSTPSTSAAASAPLLSLQDVAANNRFIDAPLPSPGPLLGKTPLVEAYNHGDRKSGEIVIRKVHDDQQSAFVLSNKRVKYEKGYPQESLEPSISLRPISPPTHSKNTFSVSNYSNMESSDKNNDRSKRYSSSGGCMIPISECPDVEMSPKMIRTPLLSGGSFQEMSPKPKDLQQSANKASATPKMMIPITPLTPSLPPSLQMSGPTHFQFPPINSITAFNPLTLPFVQHNGGEKVIPYVPGIPGPNCLTPQLPPPPQQLQVPIQSRNSSPNRQKMTEPSAFSPKAKAMLMETDVRTLGSFGGSSHLKSEFNRIPPSPAMRAARWVASVGAEISKKSSSFNFSRMADNVSPRKVSKAPENEKEIRHFNFDYLAKEPESVATTKPDTMTPLHVEVSNSYRRSLDSSCEPSAEAFEEKSSPSKRSKFLRPTSLPLKPGTFTPKRHHGITPTANTLPLISPETPRPSKATVQLYLNGHAYTYLGLKCSTKMFYCTVNCPQPSYVANMHKLSMYSVWQVCAENNPHPLGFKPKTVLSLYDARQKSCAFTMSGRPSICTTVHSQNAVMTPFENNSGQFYHHQLKAIPALAEETSKMSDSTGDKDSGNSQQPPLIGGYESYEDYTYIRGRGRGRFVCMECGIRCKKPSMLKKHIRTHTDVRPYTCIDCNFSFKTKGNLTKHMQSKTHFKKCFELGINPGPMPADGKFMEPDFEYDQQSITSGGGRTSSFPGESESDDYSDNETESSDTDESKSRLQEHEAARCLLSLSMTPPIASSVSPKDSYTYQQTESHAPQQQVLRRVVSFTSPKPPFDYQKQEQYYSNPRESQPLLPSTQDESTMLPIDLTKPRPQESVKPISTSTQFAAHMRDIIGVVNNESMFMKSLINVTDRVRNKIESSAARLDTSAFHNAYLTEQALHYSKIKQSQMNRNSNEVTSSSNGTTSTNVSHLSMCTTTTVSSSAVVSSGAVMTTTSKQIEPITPTSSDESKPEKVAATEQAKPESESAVNVPVTATATATPTSAEPSATLSAAPVKAKVQGNAKSVASEYLKMASLKSKSSTRPEESGDESVSDHEALTADSAVPSVPSTTQASASSAPTTGQEYSSVIARTVIVGEDGFRSSSNEVQPVYPRVPISSDGRPVCTICSKAFQKQHQLVLHMNIHYMERKFKCEPCAVSFRTQGHLQKHERSEGHKTKIMMTSTFGVPTTKNPRPFECTDCKIAFRIHGHLAKHLRSKTHVQKLECLQKLPFGTYAEIERAGISLTEIDTSDCDNSLISLKVLAQKLIDLDPTKMGTYTTPSGMQDGPNQSQNADSGSEDGYDAQNPNDDAGKGDENSSSAQNSGGHGLKRRMQPFSSSDEEQQQQQQQHQLDSLLPEKRPRTHSDVSSN